MLILHYENNYNFIVEFDPISNQYKKKERPKKFTRVVDGNFFEDIYGYIVLYFDRYKELLILVINGNEYELNENTIVESIGGYDKIKQLIVKRNNVVIYKVNYTTSYEQHFGENELDMVDDEDFDIGLWLSNISKSSERKKIFLEVRGKPSDI